MLKCSMEPFSTNTPQKIKLML